MFIKSLLKKYKPSDFSFVQYNSIDGGEVRSLIVKISDLDAYDVLNKTKILNMAFEYKKGLDEYVSINEKEISLRAAKKLAKQFLKKFDIYCEEEEYFKHPSRLKPFVSHEDTSKPDIIM